jgi:hypothetical protein
MISRRRFLQASLAAPIAGASWHLPRDRALAEGGLHPPAAPASEAIRPDKTIRLFNGRDLDGLYGWLKDTHYEDPQPAATRPFAP